MKTTTRASIPATLKVTALAAFTLLAGCQNATPHAPAVSSATQLPPLSQMKPTVTSEGSLANAQLIADTTAGINTVLGGNAITADTKIMKFVIQQPVGTPGARAWREMWAVSGQPKGATFIVTFRETGMNGADFEITRP